MGNGADCTLATCPVPDGFLSSPPSVAGSAVFLVAFSFLIPINLFTGIRYRTPLYNSIIIAGLAFEVMGYIGRLLLKSDVASTSYFALYLTGVSMAPTLLTAAIFLILPRIVVLYGKEFTLISHPVYFSIFFIALGTFALAFEIAGAVFTATGGIPEEMIQGTTILIAGLVIQAASIALFYATYWYFRYRLHHRRYVLDPKYVEVYSSAKFKVFMMCMQLAAAFLLVRTVVQIIALTEGLDGSISQSEIASMMLDGVTVLVSCVILSTLPAGLVFGRVWQDTSPFTSCCSGGEDNDGDTNRGGDYGNLPLRRRRQDRPGTHRRTISPPFPAVLPGTYQPPRPPYRPAGPAPRPPQRMPVYNPPPYASSSPRRIPILSPGACTTPTTPPSSSKMPTKASLVESDSLW